MQWILQEYNTEKYGSPSWRSLVRAISMVDKALSNKLAQAHQPRGKLIIYPLYSIRQIVKGGMIIACLDRTE